MGKLLFLALLLPCLAKAQLKSITFFAAANYPAMGSVTQQQNLLLPTHQATGYSHIVSATAIKTSFSNKIGFEAGGRADLSISKALFLSVGLQMNYLRYKVNHEVTAISPGSFMPPSVAPVFGGAPIGTFFGGIKPTEVLLTPITVEDQGNTTVLMLQLPLTVGTRLANDRIRLGVGPVFSYLLYATQISSRLSPGTAGTIERYKDSSKSNFEEYQAGAIMQATYFITDKLGVEVSGQKFFTPVYEASAKAKYNTLSLGLSYSL